MTPDSLLEDNWRTTVERLGGAAALAESAARTKAFVRPRRVPGAAELLRLVLAYCLGHRGLRATSAWAAASGLVDISNVGLLYRLRQCGDWLALLVCQLLTAKAPPQSKGRLIRIIDATTVLKAGEAARRRNRLWRIHSAFDLPAERFGQFELTDEHGGEQIDRIAVVPGEIRIGDAVYMQPDRIAEVQAQGGDILVRSGWRNGRWLDADGEPFALLAMLRAATTGVVDCPVWVGRKSEPPLALRLVMVRKPESVLPEARRKARRQAKKSGYQVSQETLIAAEWVILVTSLDREAYSTDDILALYRLRWRVELAFKRLKSLVGLRSPPGKDPRTARPFVLAHLLLLLLLEPRIDALEDSPRSA
jgi:hypothetical protein